MSENNRVLEIIAEVAGRNRALIGQSSAQVTMQSPDRDVAAAVRFMEEKVQGLALEDARIFLEAAIEDFAASHRDVDGYGAGTIRDVIRALSGLQ